MADHSEDTGSSDSLPLSLPEELLNIAMASRNPASNTPQGYDQDFVPTPDLKYECPICLMILKEPQQTQCGHRFCQGCINKWLRESQHRCPVDNEPIDEKLIFPDNFAKREILMLTVRCSNYKRGCGELIELKRLEKHLQVCQKGYSPCPNKCSDVLLRCDIPEHLNNKCSKRMVPCDYCGTSTQFDLMQEHLLECPLMSVRCEFCGVELLKQDLARHVHDECQEVATDCWFKKLGCQTKVKRVDIPKHMQAFIHVHMRMIAGGIERIMNILGDQNSEQSSDSSTVRALPQEMSSEFSSVLVGAQGLSFHFPDMPSVTEPGPKTSFASTNTTRSLPVSAIHSASATPSEHLTRSLTGPFSIPSLGSVSRNLSDRTDVIKQSYRSGHTSNEDNQCIPSLNTGMPSVSHIDFHSMKVQNVYQDESLALHDQQLAELSIKSETQEKANRELRLRLKSLENVISEFEGRNCSGVYIWKIKNYSKLRADAKLGDCPAVHSPPFYSSYHGYKLCVRANLNGVNTAKGTHLSIFIHFMQGEFDEILEWPFSGRIMLTVMDQNTIYEQRHHIQETLISTPNIAAFQRPSSTRNHKGFGYMEFIPFSVLDRSTYLTSDTLVIKAHVIPSK